MVKIVFRLKVAIEWVQSQMYLNYAEREQVRQSQRAAGFSITVLKDSVRELRYKINIFIWELAHMEK